MVRLAARGLERTASRRSFAAAARPNTIENSILFKQVRYFKLYFISCQANKY
jgi:hypothetical protein